MELTSTAFENEGKIPSKHTCDGENVSPTLRLSGVPAQAKALVLIMDDPDVPPNVREDGVWDHWVVFNIPPDVREISEGQEPPGTPGLGTNGETGYFGPCPPDREHRYFFYASALDAPLDLPEKTDKVTVQRKTTGHVIDNAVIMGRYERV